MKNKPLKVLLTAASFLGLGFAAAQGGEKDTAPLKEVSENPFQDLSDDEELLAKAIEAVMEKNFPELWHEQNGSDIAISGPVSTFEDVQIKARDGDVWEKEDIHVLYHLAPEPRLDFFKQLERAQKMIPLSNDEAVLLTQGMSKVQLKEFRQIDTHKASYKSPRIGDLIDSVLEIQLSPEPLYTRRVDEVTKKGPPPKRHLER